MVGKESVQVKIADQGPRSTCLEIFKHLLNLEIKSPLFSLRLHYYSLGSVSAENENALYARVDPNPNGRSPIVLGLQDMQAGWLMLVSNYNCPKL